MHTGIRNFLYAGSDDDERIYAQECSDHDGARPKEEHSLRGVTIYGEWRFEDISRKI